MNGQMLSPFNPYISEIFKNLEIDRMSFYRSDTVNHYKLILPRESAWEIMNKFGQKNLIHVVPSKSPFLSKPFVPQVKRCDECLLKLKAIETLLEQKRISLRRKQLAAGELEHLYEHWDSEYSKNQHPISMLDEIDLEVEKIWEYYTDLNKRIEDIAQRISFYRQNMAVIKAAQYKFGRRFFSDGKSDLMEQQGIPSFGGSSSKVSYKVGVFHCQEELRFKRTIFRITKGNCFVFCIPFAQIFQKLLKDQQNKTVFFVMFPGLSGNYLEHKIDKLITMYSTSEYSLPNSPALLDAKVKSLQNQYVEAEGILTLHETQENQYLRKIAQNVDGSHFSKVQTYKFYMAKEKQIYGNLNEMDLYNNFVQGEIFVRRQDLDQVQNCLLEVQRTSKVPAGQLVEAKSDKIPTYFIRNDYTRSAQEIVETYGVAKYKQANPSFFTTITFPFLFGVMFGDMAHGSILFVFGLYLIWSRKGNNAVLKALHPHRYLITLMGFFATYCGLIYNDFMSLSLNMFGTCYDLTNVEPDQGIPRSNSQCVYPVGLDPIWAVASNNLNYINSLKMKISVIIAVVHMTLGVFVKASNALFFKKKIDFLFQFVPQLIFMVFLFGYMDFLIVFKWLQHWPLYDPTSPSIITTMINLPLKLGKTDNCCGGQPMWGTYQQTSQNSVQLFLLVISVLCVPMMLLPKPLYLIYCKKSGNRQQRVVNSEMKQSDLDMFKSEEFIDEREKINSNNRQEDFQEPNSHHEHEEPSEIFVHQLIETIEYVLGCISNTASYLRLWALSLAHSQLSEVFFQKTVESGIEKGYIGIFIMVLGFPVLAGATFGVLLCMDSMECFLHTLRLHWVEFQNKFYKGDGELFVPYSFSTKIQEQLSTE